MRRRNPLALAVVLVVLAACSSDDDAATGTASTPELGSSASTSVDSTTMSTITEHAAEHDAGHATEPAVVDDKGLALLSNGEMSHEYGPDEPLDAETRERLAQQLALTRLIAARFPTLKDARDAGSKPAGAFGPGLGIHMSMPAVTIDIPDSMRSASPPDNGELGDELIVRPGNLLYAGSDDDSLLAGFMYLAMTPGEPEGFAGPNDHWHTHGSLCLEQTPDGIETIQAAEKTAEACEAAGGFFVAQTTYMVHVWTIPGYESNRGVFSDVNPAIACSDGTYYAVDRAITDRYQLNKCRADAA